MSSLVLLAGDLPALLTDGVPALCRWDLRDGLEMPAEMRWRVASAEPCAVVRLVGTLDAAAVDPVRAALLTFLADQPSAVVVDLAHLSVPEPTALAIFAAAASESSHWPAGRLMISSPGGWSDQGSPALNQPNKNQPGEGWTGEGWPGEGWGEAELFVADGVPEVVELLATTAPEPDCRLELDPVVGAARLARQFTSEQCARWEVEDLAETACIAVTELVNNVVAHAGTPMALRLRLRGGALQLAVRDHSTSGRPARTGPTSPTSPGGRGLLLLDTLAREWGATTLIDGKLVWALLHPEDEPPG